MGKQQRSHTGRTLMAPCEAADNPPTRFFPLFRVWLTLKRSAEVYLLLSCKYTVPLSPPRTWRCLSVPRAGGAGAPGIRDGPYCPFLGVARQPGRPEESPGCLCLGTASFQQWGMRLNERPSARKPWMELRVVVTVHRPLQFFGFGRLGVAALTITCSPDCLYLVSHAAQILT